MDFSQKIIVVIPCYKVSKTILSVLKKIDSNVSKIIIVDDHCPENTGNFIKENIHDDRIEVIFHQKNLGVGGAMKTGYFKALEMGADIVVKIDGDGQMDPSLLIDFVIPILNMEADYTKGNRFYNPEFLHAMPKIRLIGNGILSFINKVVSGYWKIMDPTNGYTAINRIALKSLPLEKLDDRFFFENDILFRLNTIRAKVVDIPMDSVYNQENSNLSICKTLFVFPFKYLNRFYKRLFYSYYLRDFNIASIEILIGTTLFLFGVLYGGVNWYLSSLSHENTPTGTIVLSSTSLIISLQLILSALNFDMMNSPEESISKSFSHRKFIK